MTEPLNVLGIAGSLRAGSYNRALLLAARELAPAGIQVTPFDLRAIPFYDGDTEREGDPEPVAALKEAIGAADALLIVTPEYNYSVPGVLKNALDWASRPALGSPLAGKPVAIAGASTGLGGTRRAQEHLRQALAFPRANVLDEPKLCVPEAYARFDDNGRLVDEETIEGLQAMLEGLRHIALISWQPSTGSKRKASSRSSAKARAPSTAST
jgi:chromate reductase, NAD(P)H dehydrogenase (quinone)